MSLITLNHYIKSKLRKSAGSKKEKKFLHQQYSIIDQCALYLETVILDKEHLRSYFFKDKVLGSLVVLISYAGTG